MRAADTLHVEVPKKHPGAIGEDDHRWRLEPHACRHCFGRVASRPGTGSATVYACTTCGAEAEAGHPGAICCCGIQTCRDGDAGEQRRMVDAGVRCHENPSPSPEFPARIVASYKPN